MNTLLNDISIAEWGLGRISEAPIVDASDCGCAPADTVGLERTRFFPRQLVAPDDLTQDQRYFRDKHRRHNRLLHGWGVVCGARVMNDPDNDCAVIVEPGYVLGPWGDEIVIENRVRVDLCKQDVDGNAVSPCGDAADPWCRDVSATRRDGQTLYVAVKYSECDTRPVRTLGCGCGCDESDCEYSRTKDSYAIRVLTELPSSYDGFGAREGRRGYFYGLSCMGGRVCPPCPADPWVILADVTLTNGVAGTPDCFAHRRYVLTNAYGYAVCDDYVKTVGDYSEVVDMRAAKSAPPAATFTLHLASGRWLQVPAGFTVEPGDTVRTMLAREGDREFADPATGDTFTLRELYAAAHVDPDRPLTGTLDAVVPLEGKTIDVAGLRAVRAGVDALLDGSARKQLDAEHLGSPSAASALPATALAGIGDKSAVAKAVAKSTIAEVAGQSQEAFVAAATKGIRGEARKTAEASAATVWTAASRVAALAESFRGPAVQ